MNGPPGQGELPYRLQALLALTWMRRFALALLQAKLALRFHLAAVPEMSKDQLRRTLTAKDGPQPVKLNVYSATPFHSPDVEAGGYGNAPPNVDPGLLNKRFKQQVRTRWCASALDPQQLSCHLACSAWCSSAMHAA